jgi:hypothetical protein
MTTPKQQPKKKKTIPTDIPIVWVNIVETPDTQAAFL